MIMRVLAILQMILGGLTTFAAWILVEMKANIVTPPSSDGMYPNTPPPTYILEFVILFFGLAIITCGYFQRKTHTKYAWANIVSGLAIVIISAFLSVRAITIEHGQPSSIYYLAYLILALGLAVFVIGFFQIVKTIRQVR
jgi:phosphate starvation-inducible membrane PsiE